MNYSSKFEFAEIDGDSLEFNAGINAGGVNADIKEVAANALAHAKILLSHWLEGKFEGDEFVALNPSREDGKLGSFKINVKTGRWSDFATGESGGDIVSYYAHVNSLKDNCAYPQQEAANRIACDLPIRLRSCRLCGPSKARTHAPRPSPRPAAQGQWAQKPASARAHQP